MQVEPQVNIILDYCNNNAFDVAWNTVDSWRDVLGDDAENIYLTCCKLIITKHSNLITLYKNYQTLQSQRHNDPKYLLNLLDMAFRVGDIEKVLCCGEKIIQLKKNSTLEHYYSAMLISALQESPNRYFYSNLYYAIEQSLASQKKGHELELYQTPKIMFEEWFISLRGEEKTIKEKLNKYELIKWLGNPIEKNILLLWYHHGFGDSIMYLRYVYNIIQQSHPSAQLIIVLQEELLCITDTFPTTSQISFIHDDALLEHLDKYDIDTLYYQSFISVLYLFHQKEAPSIFPFIKIINKYHLKQVKFATTIALIWKSSKPTYYSLRRDMPLEHLWHLREFKDKVQFVILAHGVAKCERDEVVDMLGAVDAAEDIHNFKDAAEYISECDLLISVDTAYVHLAGSMGKDVWMLDRWDHEWRWPKDPTEQNEWYPTLRIFRQPISRGWHYVMQDVKHALNQWLEHKEKSS